MDFETLIVRAEGGVLFVEISAPPMNLEGPELIHDLVSLIQKAEADETVQVLVFKSADPDYFIAHVDVTRIKENREAAAKLNGDPSIGQLYRYLSASRLVSIARSKVGYAEWEANSYSHATCALPPASRRFSVSSSRRLE